MRASWEEWPRPLEKGDMIAVGSNVLSGDGDLYFEVQAFEYFGGLTPWFLPANHVLMETNSTAKGSEYFLSLHV